MLNIEHQKDKSLKLVHKTVMNTNRCYLKFIKGFRCLQF